MIKIKNIFYSAICLIAFVSEVFAQAGYQTIDNPTSTTQTPPTPPLPSNPTPSIIATPPTNSVPTNPTPTNPTLTNPEQNKSSSTESVSTSEAIDQINKTLLFSDKDAALQKSIERKASTNIDYSGNKSSKPAVKILVNNQSLSKKDQQIEQKQTLAYNASIAGQYEVAVELYKQILKSDPQNHQASFSLAACYHKLNQYKQAKTLYYQLLKYEWAPDVKEQLIGNLIEVIVEESPNEAIYILSKLSAQNPESAYIMAGTAMAYDKIKKPDQAILLLKRAINIDPKQVKYKFNLAIIYDKIGDSQNAINSYQEVISNYISSANTDESIPLAQIKQRIEFLKNKAQ